MFDISRFRQYISDIFNEVSYVLLEMETEFCPSGSFPRKFSCVLENEQTSSSASGVRDALLPDSGTGEGSGYRLRGRFFYRVDAAPRAGGALLRRGLFAGFRKEDTCVQPPRGADRAGGGGGGKRFKSAVRGGFV